MIKREQYYKLHTRSEKSKPNDMTYYLKDKVFSYCQNCNHYHYKQLEKYKTQQTESLQIQQSAIFDIQANLKNLIASQIVSLAGDEYKEGDNQQKKEVFSTASNSLKILTHSPGNSRSSGPRTIIRLKPRNITMKQRQI